LDSRHLMIRGFRRLGDLASSYTAQLAFNSGVTRRHIPFQHPACLVALASKMGRESDSLTPSAQREGYFSLLYDQVGLTECVLAHPHPGCGTSDSPYLVDFLPDDPRNPMQFTRSRKWTIALVQAIATPAVAFASSAYSGGVSSIIQTFHVSTTVAIMGVSFFVLGFTLGPLMWAPLSELFGRQRLFIITFISGIGSDARLTVVNYVPID
jgi:hypothetical protein